MVVVVSADAAEATAATLRGLGEVSHHRHHRRTRHRRSHHGELTRRHATDTAHNARGVQIASYLLMAAALLLVMERGLLPGCCAPALGLSGHALAGATLARLYVANSPAAKVPLALQPNRRRHAGHPRTTAADGTGAVALALLHRRRQRSTANCSTSWHAPCWSCG